MSLLIVVHRSCLSNQNKTNTKVDKIIFVASAKSRELPKDLIEAVISEATESSRGKLNR